MGNSNNAASPLAIQQNINKIGIFDSNSGSNN
jgi:hypothetical protein